MVGRLWSRKPLSRLRRQQRGEIARMAAPASASEGTPGAARLANRSGAWPSMCFANTAVGPHPAPPSSPSANEVGALGEGKRVLACFSVLQAVSLLHSFPSPVCSSRSPLISPSSSPSLLHLSHVEPLFSSVIDLFARQCCCGTFRDSIRLLALPSSLTDFSPFV